MCLFIPTYIFVYEFGYISRAQRNMKYEGNVFFFFLLKFYHFSPFSKGNYLAFCVITSQVSLSHRIKHFMSKTAENDLINSPSAKGSYLASFPPRIRHFMLKTKEKVSINLPLGIILKKKSDDFVIQGKYWWKSLINSNYRAVKYFFINTSTIYWEGDYNSPQPPKCHSHCRMFCSNSYPK